MKKALCFLFVLFLLTNFCAIGLSETIVTYGGAFSPDDTGYQTFLAEHPDILVAWPNVVYSFTSEFMTALLTKQYYCDMFAWGTSQIDWPILMKKGYCYDLSKSQLLVEAVSKMHPYISKQAMYDGKLFAIPTDVNFIFMQIEENTWYEAGLALEDVPQSFQEFLDFLEHWCDRIDNEPEPMIRILGGWESQYTESSYTAWLTKLLINEAIMQAQYAEEELHFDNEELLALLERCYIVGRRVYSLESPSGKQNLFDESSRGVWPTNYANVIFLRQNSTQPKLVKTVIKMWAVCSYTDKPDLCLELLEKVVTGSGDLSLTSDMFLYSNAIARINPNYESDLARWTDELNTAVEQLQKPNLDMDEISRLEKASAVYTGAIETVEKNKWLMLPEQLTDYQAAADRLNVPPPSIFDESQELDTMEKLYNRFANGLLTADQLIKELDHMAQMIRLESN